MNANPLTDQRKGVLGRPLVFYRSATQSQDVRMNEWGPERRYQRGIRQPIAWMSRAGNGQSSYFSSASRYSITSAVAATKNVDPRQITAPIAMLCITFMRLVRFPSQSYAIVTSSVVQYPG